MNITDDYKKIINHYALILQNSTKKQLVYSDHDVIQSHIEFRKSVQNVTKIGKEIINMIGRYTQYEETPNSLLCREKPLAQPLHTNCFRAADSRLFVAQFLQAIVGCKTDDTIAIKAAMLTIMVG